MASRSPTGTGSKRRTSRSTFRLGVQSALGFTAIPLKDALRQVGEGTLAGVLDLGEVVGLDVPGHDAVLLRLLGLGRARQREVHRVALLVRRVLVDEVAPQRRSA